MRIPPPLWLGRLLRLVPALSFVWAATSLLAAAVVSAAAATSPPSPPPTTRSLVAVKPTQATETCVTEACHAGIVAHKIEHGPVAQQKCQACHAYVEPREHRFRLASDQAKLCGDCHVMNHRTVVHKPVREGQCTGCHDPHGSDFRAMLVADPAQGLCLKCHKQDFAARQFVHGPVAAGACILCHEVHSSWQPKLLTETPQTLCLNCHKELSPNPQQARHVHGPVKEAQCTACHDAHASNVKFQLRQAAPALCISCHKETEKMLADSHVVHGAVSEGAACSACHSPHFSELPKLQRAAQPASCLGCHDKQIKTKDGVMLADMATLLKDNPQQHGPIREGACTACHQPHAAEKFRLLAADYPPEFYAPFKEDRYALCFKCHITDLVLKQQGTGLTQFRNGDVNLHWVHVNREKGRTCRACHEVHASKNAFHIRDAVPFGDRGWLLEIGFKQAADGGGCAPGCHKPKAYNRVVAVENPKDDAKTTTGGAQEVKHEDVRSTSLAK
jgi:predicted CXXCH cytochrome family protein